RSSLRTFYFSTPPRPPTSTLFPYTTLFRSLNWLPGQDQVIIHHRDKTARAEKLLKSADTIFCIDFSSLSRLEGLGDLVKSSTAKDRKSTRLNSSHVKISYAVFCLKKKRKVR